MASKIYQAPGPAITWAATGGDAAITLTSLAAGAGRQGALHDFGTAARPYRFAWRAWVKTQTAPTVGAVIEIYWKTSDGVHADNSDGTADGPVSSEDKLRNLRFLGVMVMDAATTGNFFVASGVIEHHHRHGAPVFWNRNGAALSANAADHGFSLLAVPDEVQ